MKRLIYILLFIPIFVYSQTTEITRDNIYATTEIYRQDTSIIDLIQKYSAIPTSDSTWLIIKTNEIQDIITGNTKLQFAANSLVAVLDGSSRLTITGDYSALTDGVNQIRMTNNNFAAGTFGDVLAFIGFDTITFSGVPRIADGVSYTPTDLRDLITKEYVDNNYISATDTAFYSIKTDTALYALNSPASSGVYDSLKVGFIDLDTALSNPNIISGRMFWDSTLRGPKMYMNDEVTLNIGRELFIYGVNRSSRVMVSGDVVYVGPLDASGVAPLRLSIADNKEISEATVAVITETIGIGEKGYATKFGAVGLDASGYSSNDLLYLSPYDSGMVVNNAPESPYYKVAIGRVIKSGVNGILGVDVRGFTGNDTEVAIDGLLNGIILEKQSVSAVKDGHVLYFETDNELRDTMNLPYMYHKNIYKLNTTTNTGTGGRARVSLAYGTQSSPQINYIYINHNSGSPVLASNTTAFPTNSIPLAECSVYDSATHTLYGFAHFQRFNNAVDGTESDGWVNKSAKNARLAGTRWYSGVTPTVTKVTNLAAKDSLNFYTSSGVVPQFNFQNFDAQTKKKYYWYNKPGGGAWITDLNQITQTANGTSTTSNNARYCINVFGIQNSGSFQDYLVVAVSTSLYASDANAINDVGNRAIRTLPSHLRFTGFRIARLVVRYNTTNNGTITNLLGAGLYQDERGQLLGIGGGGGSSGGGATYPVSDATFSVNDNSDPTKIMNFQLSGITTGTTRTQTIPDKSGIIAHVSDIPTASEIKGIVDTSSFDTLKVKVLLAPTGDTLELPIAYAKTLLVDSLFMLNGIPIAVLDSAAVARIVGNSNFISFTINDTTITTWNDLVSILNITGGETTTVTANSTNFTNGDSINITTDATDLRFLNFYMGAGTAYTNAGSDSSVVYVQIDGVAEPWLKIPNEWFTSTTPLERTEIFNATRTRGCVVWLQLASGFTTGTRELTIEIETK